MQMQNKTDRLPQVRVRETIELKDVSDVLLVEFSSTAPVREVVGLEPGSPARVTEAGAQPQGHASVNGRRIRRIFHPEHGVVAEPDELTNTTPLDRLHALGYGDGCVLASARPGDTYTWQLTELRPFGPGDLTVVVAGVRKATYGEAKELNRRFPKWLKLSKEFDEGAAKAARVKAAAARLAAESGLAPPQAVGASIS